MVQQVTTSLKQFLFKQLSNEADKPTRYFFGIKIVYMMCFSFKKMISHFEAWLLILILTTVLLIQWLIYGSFSDFWPTVIGALVPNSLLIWILLINLGLFVENMRF